MVYVTPASQAGIWITEHGKSWRAPGHTVRMSGNHHSTNNIIVLDVHAVVIDAGSAVAFTFTQMTLKNI